MSNHLKTIPEILGALRETEAHFADEYEKSPCANDDDDFNYGKGIGHYEAMEQIHDIIARIESGQAQAAHKEAAYEEAWNRMIQVMQGMIVGQRAVRDAAKDRKLWHSLDGTIIALELMLDEMQAIQARIEAGE